MSNWDETMDGKIGNIDDYSPYGFRPPTRFDKAQFDHPDFWTAQNGRAILIRHLDDNHLGNILRYLQRKAESERRINIAKIMWHLLPKGPGVDKVPHRELDGFLIREDCPPVRSPASTWRHCAHPKFAKLEEEASSRGLKWNLVPDEQWGVAHDMLILHALSKGSLEFARGGDSNANRN
jgi:hypothetical protein